MSKTYLSIDEEADAEERVTNDVTHTLNCKIVENTENEVKWSQGSLMEMTKNIARQVRTCNSTNFH